MSDMIQVTPRVYQLGGIVNVYLLKTSEDELTILDAGLPGSGRRILNAAQELGYGPQAVRHLLITHADTDHVGSLAGLVKATGATVYAGPISKPYIEAANAAASIDDCAHDDRCSQPIGDTSHAGRSSGR